MGNKKRPNRRQFDPSAGQMNAAPWLISISPNPFGGFTWIDVNFSMQVFTVAVVDDPDLVLCVLRCSAVGGGNFAGSAIDIAQNGPQTISFRFGVEVDTNFFYEICIPGTSNLVKSRTGAVLQGRGDWPPGVAGRTPVGGWVSWAEPPP